MITKEIGLYVHIPYCKRKCNYCDFCSIPSGSFSVPDEYVDRLCEEIRSYKLEGLSLSTIYFGGGTPSLLEIYQLRAIFAAIRDTFVLLQNAEITLEVNPGTISDDKVKEYKKLGFNRVSMGLQSIHEKELKKLGRIHNFAEFVNSYKLIRECGIDNINVDLMYGIPHQTSDSFKQTLDSVIDLHPEHISCYGLIVEEGTPFFAERDSLPLPTLDDECDMYEMACETLSSAGYSHYEISNYSRPGFESRHNLCYWHSDEYIGVGASAHSYYRKSRFFNTSDIEEYISEKTVNNMMSAELISNEDDRYEYAMLALRLSEGFSLKEYYERYGISFLDGKELVIDRFVNAGLISLSDDRISLTEKGFYLSNSILVEIL